MVPPERNSSLLDRQQFALGNFGIWLEAGDIPMVAKAGDATGDEPVTICRCASLTIENTGDHTVWIMASKTTNERHCILVSADSCRP